jgi:death on curing protein
VSEPVWVRREALEILHGRSLQQFGGPPGLRDAGLLESALARPVNLWAYTGETGLSRLAAAYGFGIARNHPFVDGNKRAAFLASTLFLALNGLRLTATTLDSVSTYFALAAGDIGEEELAGWIAANSAPR